ncbi:MAG: M20/M25/M40 family metallo-hydrolase [Candidatus Latescibacteria bacterium]|nr:M20/M25/M40 family metallo-hydrolase [Candidatus Latescibacterota bacterium]
MFRWIAVLAVVMSFRGVHNVDAQTLASDDKVLSEIWSEAMDNSQLEQLAHELFDVIGPRLVGSPQMNKAHDWAVDKYRGWGISAQNEEWGKWRGWERGVTHIDLLEPRVRTLEGTMLAWSPDTGAEGVTAPLTILADTDSVGFQAWLPNVKGKFVLMSVPPITGRSNDNWEEFALKTTFEKMKAERDSLRKNWSERIKRYGYTTRTLPVALESAGAAGIITNRSTGGWGVDRIFAAYTKQIPTVDVALEDYGLLFRLVEHGDDPKVRIVATSSETGTTPAFNTVARIEGSEKSDEYVMLSAHFDSWDGASGATDNGTGTLTMMEALRILKKVYPNPRRTVLVGHWGSEEHGLHGSRAFVKDHPEIVGKLQALFNQDNGTGRVVRISGSGYSNSGEFLGRWLSKVPQEVATHIKLTVPGMPAGGGSDHASFVAAGAPGFGLGSLSWDYFRYTWHTNRDTYDKVVFDEVRNNVILAASLIYLASEDPEFFPREKRLLPVNPDSGERRTWPKPRNPDRAGRLGKAKK